MAAAPALPSLILFARAPRDGCVKTRLSPVLGFSGAARLYAAFLRDAARVYVGRGDWSAVLCAESGDAIGDLQAIFDEPWRIDVQVDGDLGKRLGAAFQAEFERGAPAALAVGSDHPCLLRGRLVEAFASLANGDQAVLIPARDGGYCAIGLRAGTPIETVFRDVPWSTPSVLECTLDRLREAGLRFCALAPAYDVDRPEDLAVLRRDIAARRPEEEDYPSATAAVLETLDGLDPLGTPS